MCIVRVKKAMHVKLKEKYIKLLVEVHTPMIVFSQFNSVGI